MILTGAIVKNITKYRKHHKCEVVDKNGHHELIITNNKILTDLIKVMKGTEKGLILIDANVLDGKYLLSFTKTKIPDFGDLK